jgi:hypothetical protein
MHGTHLLPELATALALGAVALGAARAVPACQATPDDTVIGLPRPVRTGGMPLAEAIARRRSVRDFTARPLSTRSLSQLCWAAQGITGQDEGLRAAPSAGALYPITIFVALPEAVHRYDPGEHALRRHRRGDRRAALRAAALGQSCVGGAPACMIVTIDVARSASKYGRWAERYCLLEAGHAAPRSACPSGCARSTCSRWVIRPMAPTSLDHGHESPSRSLETPGLARRTIESRVVPADRRERESRHVGPEDGQVPRLRPIAPARQVVPV